MAKLAETLIIKIETLVMFKDSLVEAGPPNQLEPAVRTHQAVINSLNSIIAILTKRLGAMKNELPD